MCGGHALLEDVPGTAKTVLARAIAGSIEGSHSTRIQCTPDLQPTDVTGLSIFDQKQRDFEFRPGPIFANVVLVDEINRAMPKTQSALLEAMAEQQVTVDGEQLFGPVLLHRIPFRPSFLAEIRDRGWAAAAEDVRQRCFEVAPKPGFDIDLDVPAATSS